MAIEYAKLGGREREAYLLSREAERIDAEIARLEAQKPKVE